MKNLGEQKRVFNGFLYLVISLAIFAVIFIVFYIPKLIPQANLLPSSLPSVALTYITKVSEFLNSSILATVSGLLLLSFILILLPLVVFIVAIKKRYRHSPFPEGIDKSKFSKEDFFIYQSLIEFFQEGNMRIVKGFECDQIYLNKNIYFANIAYINRTIYVNINKDFGRFDNRVDRSGAIPIARAHDLPQAKERILTIYKAHFAKYRKPALRYQ